MALRVEFLLRHGANTEERAVLLAEVPPHAAHLAETLFGAGALERLRARGGTAAEMVRRLAAMLPAADSGRPALTHGQGFAPARTADQVE